MEVVTVALVNDHEIVVAGLRRMLQPFAERVRVVETEAGGRPQEPADVVLFDTFASRDAGDRIDRVSDDERFGRLVLYTWHPVIDALDDVDPSMIDGVILKSESSGRVVDAIERVAAGERVGMELVGLSARLSDREREVLSHLARGRSNAQIGREMYISIDTVKTHLRSLYRKLGVENRTQAAMRARTHEAAESLA